MKSRYLIIGAASFVFLVIILAGSCKKGDLTPSQNDAASDQTFLSSPAVENMEQVLLSFRYVDIIISTKNPVNAVIGRILV